MKPIKCPTCHGTGEDPRSPGSYHLACRRCEGTGAVNGQPPKRVPPPGIAISLSPEAMAAMGESCDAFMRKYRDTENRYGVRGDLDTIEEHLFCAGWRAALTWISLNPELYAQLYEAS